MTMKLVKNNVSLNVMYSGHLNTATSFTEKKKRERISISVESTRSIILLYFYLAHINYV